MKTDSKEGMKENTETESDNYWTNYDKVDENNITDNGTAIEKERKILMKMCHEWQKIVKIKKFLRKDEELDSPRIQTSPLERVTNSSTSRNTSSNFGNLCDLDFISLQNKELMNILEELPNRTQVSGDNITAFTRSSHLRDISCDAVIKILEKGLESALIQKKINQRGHKKISKLFCLLMRIKCHFWNERSLCFRNSLTFLLKIASFFYGNEYSHIKHKKETVTWHHYFCGCQRL